METVSGTTIYQRIGGEAAISAAVDRFYERVLADPTLSHFFSGVSMARLKAHQFAFLSQALGGPKQYSGASMRNAHSRLAIEQRHFDSVAVHLVETLRELGVPEEIISEIAAGVTPLSSQIVNTHGSDRLISAADEPTSQLIRPQMSRPHIRESGTAFLETLDYDFDLSKLEP